MEPVSDLTTDAFIAALRCFSVRVESLVITELTSLEPFKIFKEMYDFLSQHGTKMWKFVPECSPHFGGL